MRTQEFNTMNRRSFLQKSAISAAGLGLSPLFGSAYGTVYGQAAPSNKVKVALIGCRSMGFSNLSNFLKYPEVECVALCDIDDEWLNKRAADVEKSTGKKVPHLYKDWRKVIDNKDVDAVIIGTPDHWHCLPTVYACHKILLPFPLWNKSRISGTNIIKPKKPSASAPS